MILLDFESRFLKLDKNVLDLEETDILEQLRDQNKILKEKISSLQNPKHKNTNTVNRLEEFEEETFDALSALDWGKLNVI